MNILLVNPEFEETYWSFRHALPFEGKRSVFPPLSLLTVSSLLPASYNRRLVDLNVESLKPAQIDWADMIFITGMLSQKQSLHSVVQQAKRKGKVVVLGGPYVTSTIEELPDADHIFQGEAETTLPQFFEDLERGEAKRVYKAAERPSMELSPTPDFKLADLKHYSFVSIQYSRGCPFSCEFCDIIEIYGRVPRTKTNAQILAELDQLKALGWRGPLFIVDDNFIGNKKNVRLLLPALIEWQKRNGFPFSLLTEASVNLADDDELLANMRDAGFRRVFLGIETPVEESLKEAQKTQNRGNLLDSVKKIQSYGMEVMAGFIVGFDNDPEDIFERQINFIRESAIPLAMVGMLNALPDTQLWRRLEREGRLLGEDATGNNTISTLNFVPKMDVDKLIQGYQSIMKTIYKPREYYQRALDSLKRTPHDTPEPSPYNLIQEVKALVRLVLKLGVIDGERKEFWRFLIQAVRKHHDRMTESLRLAAMGYHFRKLNDAYDPVENEG
ncbi:MAG TPA: B12-binding domain-containing radical SAM protein [Pyrinomonadaceae bacterium]|jgi:Fe-S oxidoreductase|nr:B12-binding domain-containing radical SAM protein [Pyrinomonadaceae bacterium]